MISFIVSLSTIVNFAHFCVKFLGAQVAV